MPISGVLTKLRTTAITAAVVSTLLAVPMAGTASAGECDTPFCGGVVHNNASSSIAVTNCWEGVRGFYFGEEHSCMKNGWNLYAYKAGVLIGPRDSSSGYKFYYDVDGFRVDRGCQVVVRYGGGGTEKIYDQRGHSVSMWVGITGKTQATILRETC